MTNLIEIIRETAKEEMNKGGSNFDLSVEAKSGEPCIDACTDLKKNITIKINPEFDKESTARYKSLQTMSQSTR